MKIKKNKRKFSHQKIKLTEVEAIEREWAMRYVHLIQTKYDYLWIIIL